MVPTTEPLCITAGDSAQWERSVSNYPPSDGWTLSYHLARAGVDPTAIQAAPGDSVYTVNLTPATTAAWMPGTYQWKAVVSKTGARHVVDEGVLEIKPDPTTSHDPRTHEERMLDLVTAVLEDRASESILEQEVGGIPLKHMAHEQLVRLRGYYASLVRTQRGGSFVTLIPVRLTRGE